MKHINIEVNHHVGIGGEFRAVLYNPDGSVVHDSGWDNNQIQDNGLLIYGPTAQNGWYTTCCIGDSAGGLPAESVTVMSNVLDGTSSGVNSGINTPAGPDYHKSEIRTFTFGAGIGTGTVRQMSIGANTSGTSMFAIHVLTVPIDKLANQTLDVSYRFSMYASLISDNTQVVIGGETYDCASSFFDLLSADGVFNEASIANGNNNYTGCYTGIAATAEETNPQGSFLGGTQTLVYDATAAGFIDYTNTYSINQAIGTIRTAKSLLWSGFFGQTQFTATTGPGIGAGIPKTGDDELTLSRRVIWGRYTP